MKITKAETAGFCFGVNRAVNMVYELLNEGKKVLLAVASGWSKEKGIDTVLEISKRLCDDEKLVLVGNISGIALNENIIHIPATDSVEELVTAGVANAKKAEFFAHTGALSARLIKALEGSEIRVNLPQKRAPHIVNITLPDIKSETMLHFLSGKGIAVSAGSACSSRAAAPSGALIAFGLPAKEADCSLRISFSRENTEAVVDALVAALLEGLQKLVRIHH